MTIPFINEQSSKAEIVRAYQELADVVRLLESRLAENVEGWADNQTNVTITRAIDADTIALPELADVTGTLISDLVEAGLLR